MDMNKIADEIASGFLVQYGTVLSKLVGARLSESTAAKIEGVTPVAVKRGRKSKVAVAAVEGAEVVPSVRKTTPMQCKVETAGVRCTNSAGPRNRFVCKEHRAPTELTAGDLPLTESSGNSDGVTA